MLAVDHFDSGAPKKRFQAYTVKMNFVTVMTTGFKTIIVITILSLLSRLQTFKQKNRNRAFKHKAYSLKPLNLLSEPAYLPDCTL